LANPAQLERLTHLTKRLRRFPQAVECGQSRITQAWGVKMGIQTRDLCNVALSILFVLHAGNP
jgi:hypothetical protein